MLREDEEQAPAADAVLPEHPSWWRRLRQLFSREDRLHRLSWAITAFPDEAVNYVLRGELLLERGEALAAAQDFQRALELAAQRVETEDWGVVAQSLQDRALDGFRDAVVRAARYNPNTSQTDNE